MQLWNAGVVGMAEVMRQRSVARLLPTYRLRKGDSVTPNSKGVQVDAHIVVEQGVNITSVVDSAEAQ